DWRAFADGMDLTLEKHSALFAQHRAGRAKYLGAMGVYYLRAGDWGAAVKASVKALPGHPQPGQAFVRLLRSLAGPRVDARLSRRTGGIT
ncbi:MAG: hypothetical protein M3273_06430, partial [Actinomycetota bacterium]|nr:hypothetical protein [Actinomycetota bacterium]